MKENKISIIIPIYNTNKKYLRECIDSIKKQNNKNFEVILVNDGSSKECTANIEEIIKNEKNFILINKENGGVSSARNKGIEVSSGNWIMFIDADDYLQENAFDILYDIIEKNYYIDIVVAQCNVVKNDNIRVTKFGNNKGLLTENAKINLQKSIFGDRNTDFECVDAVWGKIYKKSIIINNDLKFNTNLPLGEDGLFNFECFQQANKIYISDKIIYNYRLNDSSTIHTYKSDIIQIFDYLFMQYDELFKKYDIDEKFKKEYNYFLIRHLEKIFLKYTMHKENLNKYLNRRKQFLKLTRRDPYKDAFKKGCFYNLSIVRKMFVVFIKLRQFELIVLLYKLKERVKKDK